MYWGKECTHSITEIYKNKYKYHNAGEFGVVYEAHLLTDQDVGFTAVAVKTLKGNKITTMQNAYNN